MSSRKPNTRSTLKGSNVVPASGKNEQKSKWTGLSFQDLTSIWQKHIGLESYDPNRDLTQVLSSPKSEDGSSTEVTQNNKRECLGRCAGCGNIGITKSFCMECNRFTFDDIPDNAATPPGYSTEQKMESWWRRVTRSKIGSESLPDVGQTCLIIKGEEEKGLGHMGIVLGCTQKRVTVGYRNSKNGKQEKRVKCASSLVLLGDGLEAFNDEYGRLWISKK